MHLAGQYQQSICFDNLVQQWMALLKQWCFKQARTMLKALESLLTILQKCWRNICKPSYWTKLLFHIHQGLVECKLTSVNFSKKSHGQSISFIFWTENGSFSLESHAFQHEWVLYITLYCIYHPHPCHVFLTATTVSLTFPKSMGTYVTAFDSADREVQLK